MKTKQLIVTLSIIFFMAGIVLPLTNAAAADKFTLKYWIYEPESSKQGEVHKRYIADVMEKSNGRLNLQPYWSESLMPAKGSLSGLKSGFLDLGQFTTFLHPGEFPVSDVAGLPFMVNSLQGVTKGLRKLYAEGLMPEYDGKGFKLIDFPTPGALYIFFRDKQIEKLEQFKGLKLRGPGRALISMIKMWGATPVSVSSTDLYMSLDRGIIDGIISGVSFMAPFKLYEVGKFFLDVPVSAGNKFFAINQETWDSLPVDLQNILKECSTTMTDDWNKTFEYYDNVTSKNILKDNGVTFYQPDKIEFDKIKAATEPVVADFIKKMDALGFDGRKIVETFASAQN